MTDHDNLVLRLPTLEDGMDVYRLVENCPPLDTNSSYCNLMQCSHFARTSVAAELDGKLVGFISGYRIPDRPDCLFVWQVAVAQEARGMGLAKRMLLEILNRDESRSVRYLETTITPDNQASWALFNSLANSLEAGLEHAIWLEQDAHFDGQHDSEALVRIGPIQPQKLS